MPSSQRPDKEVATSSQRKRVRSGDNVPPAPAVPRGQIKRFRMKVGQLGAGVPTVTEVDQGVAYEVYLCRAGRALAVRSHFVSVRGVNVTITPTGINGILGTPQDTDPLVLIGLNIRHPYRAIRHTMCGPQSMVKWTKRSGKRYHQSLPYAHMLRETRVWLKIVMNCLILGLQYLVITRDRVFWVYALMKATELNIGAVLNRRCERPEFIKGTGRAVHGYGVPKENMEYIAPLFQAPVDIMRTNGPDTEVRPTLSTAARHRRDALIMAMMYGLEMLRHRNGCLASNDMQLGDVERRYLLNAHAKALLGIGPEFVSLSTDRLRTRIDVDSDSDEEVDPAQAGDEAEGGDVMED
ncbi:hypothetical protein H5410_015569 [Solanum commersonii]|uniref:Putative plant transposon protein domain-containing protein n=1 Tax=Solanum commersonii TaxID=4109 RepID=A0A9J5ZU49_SOLCO|nr:hypothetical protein H5410_015569 [Solanum commersonii]